MGAPGLPGPPGPIADCPRCHGQPATWVRGHYAPKGAELPPCSMPDRPPGAPGACPADSPQGMAAAAAAAERAAAAKERAAEQRRKDRVGKRVLDWCGKRSKCNGEYVEERPERRKPLKWFTPVCCIECVLALENVISYFRMHYTWREAPQVVYSGVSALRIPSCVCCIRRLLYRMCSLTIECVLLL